MYQWERNPNIEMVPTMLSLSDVLGSANLPTFPSSWDLKILSALWCCHSILKSLQSPYFFVEWKNEKSFPFSDLRSLARVCLVSGRCTLPADETIIVLSLRTVSRASDCQENTTSIKMVHGWMRKRSFLVIYVLSDFFTEEQHELLIHSYTLCIFVIGRLFGNISRSI